MEGSRYTMPHRLTVAGEATAKSCTSNIMVMACECVRMFGWMGCNWQNDILFIGVQEDMVLIRGVTTVVNTRLLSFRQKTMSQKFQPQKSRGRLPPRPPASYAYAVHRNLFNLTICHHVLLCDWQ